MVGKRRFFIVLSALTFGRISLSATSISVSEDFYRCAVQLLMDGEQVALKITLADSGGRNVAQACFDRIDQRVRKVCLTRPLLEPNGSFRIESPGQGGVGKLAEIVYQTTPTGEVDLEVFSLWDTRKILTGKLGRGPGLEFSLPNREGFGWYASQGIRTQLQTAFGYYGAYTADPHRAVRESKQEFLARTRSLFQSRTKISLSAVPLEKYLALARNTNSLLEKAINEAHLEYVPDNQIPVRLFFGSVERKLETRVVFEFHNPSQNLTYTLAFETRMVFTDRQVKHFTTPRRTTDLPARSEFELPLPEGEEYMEQRAILRRMDPR